MKKMILFSFCLFVAMVVSACNKVDETNTLHYTIQSPSDDSQKIMIQSNYLHLYSGSLYLYGEIRMWYPLLADAVHSVGPGYLQWNTVFATFPENIQASNLDITLSYNYVDACEVNKDFDLYMCTPSYQPPPPFSDHLLVIHSICLADLPPRFSSESLVQEASINQFFDLKSNAELIYSHFVKIDNHDIRTLSFDLEYMAMDENCAYRVFFIDFQNNYFIPYFGKGYYSFLSIAYH